MGRAVPNKGELLHPERNVLPSAAKIGIAVGERAMSGRDPEGRQISRLDEIAPESEGELCDDSTVDLRSSTSSSRSVTRLLDVRRSLLIEGCNVEPRCSVVPSMCPDSKFPIESVARNYLDHRRELHDARGGPHAPLVERERVGDISTARAQIRTEVFCCDEGK